MQVQVSVQAEQLESLGRVQVGLWARGLAARGLLRRVRVGVGALAAQGGHRGWARLLAWALELATGLARGPQRLFPPARVAPQVPTRLQGASPPVQWAPVVILARRALARASVPPPKRALDLLQLASRPLALEPQGVAGLAQRALLAARLREFQLAA